MAFEMKYLFGSEENKSQGKLAENLHALLHNLMYYRMRLDSARQEQWKKAIDNM